MREEGGDGEAEVMVTGFGGSHAALVRVLLEGYLHGECFGFVSISVVFRELHRR